MRDLFQFLKTHIAIAIALLFIVGLLIYMVIKSRQQASQAQAQVGIPGQTQAGQQYYFVQLGETPPSAQPIDVNIQSLPPVVQNITNQTPTETATATNQPKPVGKPLVQIPPTKQPSKQPPSPPPYVPPVNRPSVVETATQTVVNVVRSVANAVTLQPQSFTSKATPATTVRVNVGTTRRPVYQIIQQPAMPESTITLPRPGGYHPY